jgi:hypothetical protein
VECLLCGFVNGIVNMDAFEGWREVFADVLFDEAVLFSIMCGRSSRWSSCCGAEGLEAPGKGEVRCGREAVFRVRLRDLMVMVVVAAAIAFWAQWRRRGRKDEIDCTIAMMQTASDGSSADGGVWLCVVAEVLR